MMEHPKEVQNDVDMDYHMEVQNQGNMEDADMEVPPKDAE